MQLYEKFFRASGINNKKTGLIRKLSNRCQTLNLSTAHCTFLLIKKASLNNPVTPVHANLLFIFCSPQNHF